MFNVRIKEYKSDSVIKIFKYPVGKTLKKIFQEPKEKEHDIYQNFTIDEMIKIKFPDTSIYDENHKKLSERNSMSRTVQKVYDIARSNKWEYFFTLTFNQNYVDRYDYQKVTEKLTNWLDKYRRLNPNMKYLIIPEYHKDKAFHFHGLFANLDKTTFKDSGIKDKQGRIIYNIQSYKLGFTTVTEITSHEKATNYITKYITKELIELSKGKKRYWNSKNLDSPIVTDLFLDKKQIEILKDSTKKITVYEKTVEVETQAYTNTINIIQINNNANI